MRDRSITPTNLLDWPRCRGLLPDQRLILLWLWACPYLSCAGAGLVPLAAAGATLGLDPAALAGGLASLRDAQLLELDKDTGEIFIRDWFRFHRFSTPVAIKTLDSAVLKIESDPVREAVIQAMDKVIHNTQSAEPKKQVKPIKSTTCLPTPTSTSTSISIQPPPSAREAAAVAAGGGNTKVLEACTKLRMEPGAARRAAKAAEGAAPDQLEILLVHLQGGKPAWSNDLEGWAVAQAQKAAQGELERPAEPAAAAICDGLGQFTTYPQTSPGPTHLVRKIKGDINARPAAA